MKARTLTVLQERALLQIADMPSVRISEQTCIRTAEYDPNEVTLGRAVADALLRAGAVEYVSYRRGEDHGGGAQCGATGDGRGDVNKVEFEVCKEHTDEVPRGCPWCEIDGLEIDLDNAEEARDDAIEDAHAEFADDADCAEAAEQVWAALREGKPFEPDVWPFDELRFRLRRADRRAL